MKMINTLCRFPVALLVFMFMTSDAWADDINWWRVSANSLIVADWLQTHEIASNDDYIELNKNLDEHPTNWEVNRYFITNLLLVNLVGELLPEQYSDMFYVAVSVNSGYFVFNNYTLGVRIDF